MEKKLPGTKSNEETVEAVIFVVNNNQETIVTEIVEETVITTLEPDNDHESIKRVKK